MVWLRTDKISSKIHNYINIASNTKVINWSSRSSNICDCKNSKYRNPILGHIVTGNLDCIDNPFLKSLLAKGANYREPKFINWNRTLKEINNALQQYCNTWSKTENKSGGIAIQTWLSNVLELVNARIVKLKTDYDERNFNFYEKLNSKKFKVVLARIHK